MRLWTSLLPVAAFTLESPHAILEACSVRCLRGYTEDMGDMLSSCTCSA